MRIFKNRKLTSSKEGRLNLDNKKVRAIDLLISTPGLWAMDEVERAKMTISCRDADYIQKVTNAGKLISRRGSKVQVMHNGVLVEAGGYHGRWMIDIIRSLKGHHEPQEEKVFYEVVKRLDRGASMIEMGSFWAYYSIWFNLQVKGARNVCCEPDPNNLLVDKRNARLNNASITFFQGAAGCAHKEQVEITMDSDSSRTVKVDTLSVDGLMRDLGWKYLSLLHVDVQGFEYDTLRGAVETIKAGRLRFLFVSTHHYYFSHNVNTHAECLNYIKEHGGHIIAAHTVAESYSGDGLIVASFDERDKNFKVDVSINHTDQSLFRPTEQDLNILSQAYGTIC